MVSDGTKLVLSAHFFNSMYDENSQILDTLKIYHENELRRFLADGFWGFSASTFSHRSPIIFFRSIFKIFEFTSKRLMEFGMKGS